MAKRNNHVKPRRGWPRIALCPLAASLLLTACQQEPKTKAPEVRPVRTMTVEKGEIGEKVSLTGRIQAENEATLAFRISGRMSERPVGVGDRVEPDEVLARLDPQDELNGLRSAQARLVAAQGRVREARNAVILIEQIETERAEGRETWDAVVQGTLSRFRPIMLTAISTVLGFIPIAPTVFWGPMAFAIMGGLFVATMLTLIVLPALYVAWFRIKEPLTGGGAA